MLFNSTYTGYEEIFRYYPQYYRNVREMDAIIKAYGDLSDGMETNIDAVFMNAFISSMDEATLLSFADFLGISSSDTEEIRSIIKSYFVGNRKVSKTSIEEMIETYLGVTPSVTLEDYDEEKNQCLRISIPRWSYDENALKTVQALVGSKVPAHIIVKYDYARNYWNDETVTAMTWDDASTSTWERISMVKFDEDDS